MPGRKPNQTLEVELSLGFPSTMGGDAHALLEVIDQASRETLCQVKLTPDDFLHLMRGRVLTIEALAPDQKGLRRIGRLMKVDSLKAPARFSQEREVVPELELWAAGECARRGYEEHSLRRDREGWTALFRRWEA